MLPQLLFWPPTLLADALAVIERGESVLILGPRRSGKSTLLRAISEACRRENMIIGMNARMEPWDLLRMIAPDKRSSIIEQQARAALTTVPAGFQNAIEAIVPSQQFLLLIDDFEFALDRNGEIWTTFLEILRSSRPQLSLVICSDPAALIYQSAKATGSRFFPGYRILHLTPWPADLIENFIRTIDPDGKYRDGDLPHTLAQLLAPAWPYEVLTVLFAVDQLDDRSPTSIERVLDDLTLRMYGPESVEKRVRDVLSPRDSEAARYLLSAFGLGAEKLSLTEASERSGGRIAEHDFVRAGQSLASLSFLQFITPRSLQPLTGLVRRKLQLDYAGTAKQ